MYDYSMYIISVNDINNNLALNSGWLIVRYSREYMNYVIVRCVSLSIVNTSDIAVVVRKPHDWVFHQPNFLAWLSYTITGESLKILEGFPVGFTFIIQFYFVILTFYFDLFDLDSFILRRLPNLCLFVLYIFPSKLLIKSLIKKFLSKNKFL